MTKVEISGAHSLTPGTFWLIVAQPLRSDENLLKPEDSQVPGS